MEKTCQFWLLTPLVLLNMHTFLVQISVRRQETKQSEIRWRDLRETNCHILLHAKGVTKKVEVDRTTTKKNDSVTSKRWNIQLQRSSRTWWNCWRGEMHCISLAGPSLHFLLLCEVKNSIHWNRSQINQMVYPQPPPTCLPPPCGASSFLWLLSVCIGVRIAK